MTVRNSSPARTRKVALALCAGALGASLALTGCASGDKAQSPKTTVSDEAGIGLDGAHAKEILAGALNSTDATVGDYVDTSNPQTAADVKVVDRGLDDAGISADSFTVTKITDGGKVNGNPVAYVSAEADVQDLDQPITADLQFIELDGTWKLSADGVKTLKDLVAPEQ